MIQLYQKYRELVELQRPLVDSLGLFEVIAEVGEMRKQLSTSSDRAEKRRRASLRFRRFRHVGVGGAVATNQR